MIWQSIELMTAFDLFFIAVVTGGAIAFWSNGRKAGQPKPSIGFAAIIAGLVVTALFYLADLLVMHVYPLYSSDEETMIAMHELHLNYRWVASLFGTCLLVIGFVFAQSAYLQAIKGERKAREDLEKEFKTRQKAEEALRDREAQLRSIVDHMPAAVYLKDLEGRYIQVSRRYENWFGLSNESVRGRTPLQVHPARLGEPAAKFDRTVRETGQEIEHEEEVVIEDGAHTFLNSKFPIEDLSGGIIGTGAIITDITERKRAEDKLRESEERLRQATRLAKIGYSVWDAVEDRCEFSSEEHARIHGVSPNEYIARASALDGEMSLTHPDDRETVRATLQALRRGKPFELEYRVITPTGEVRHVREIHEPIFGDDGKVVQEVGAIQDITEVKTAEAHLRQAQKMEAVGQLTAGVAHDFNNLLAVILGNLELLESRLGEDEELRNRAKSGITAARRGAELTQRLLAFGRRQALNATATDLNTLVSQSTDLLNRTLGETIEIQVVPGKDLWVTSIDQTQLEAALLNLAVNARDAMPNGGKLTIETANARIDSGSAEPHRDVKPGSYVVLSVTDSGTGMSPEVMAQAFEPFFTTKPVGKGSGLGLSMVFGFAKQSGGHIKLYSEPGQGTTVELYFPKTNSLVEVLGGAAAARSETMATGEVVMVVEDDPDVRDIVWRNLASLGYEVLLAEDGPSALGILERSERIDLLLTDVVLGGTMNGVDLARHAQAHRSRPKVLYMSGYAEDAIVDNGPLKQGVNLIGKPFKKSALAQKVRAILHSQDCQA